MADGGEFVEGWLVAQVLGEGTYGEVRLLVHARSGAAVALKAVRSGADGSEGGAREAALHRALRHPHVLRCLGERQHRGLHYVFLEYASGGELFDRIEPDVGMEGAAARRYWRQLLSGVQYLHSRGVAHRDIKPENLLLDANDNLKISDFGMATLFRHGSRERLLSRVCGTAPYAAPEVLAAALHPYRAAPADLWSAALVLFAALLGELPWERAVAEDGRYRAWVAWASGTGGSNSVGTVPPPPFCRLEPGALGLLKQALFPDPTSRATLSMLLRDPWLCQEGAENADHRQDQMGANEQGGWRRTWCSQPVGVGSGTEQDYEQMSASDMDAALWCSQPAQADELALTAGGGGRTTRFVLACSPTDALRALEAAADSLGHRWRRMAGGALLVECEGGGAGAGGSTAVRAAAARVGGGALLELRRWRGCGLAFKRVFLRLRAALKHLLAKDQPLDPRL